MQAGCRRGHGPWMIGKDRLVTLAVRRFVLARNIGRQRNVAEAFDRLRYVSFRSQADSPQTILAAAYHFRGKLSISEIDALAHSDFASRADQCFPLLRAYLPGQKNFDFGGQNFTRGTAISARLFGANTLPAAK